MTPITNPARLNDNANFPGLVDTIEATGNAVQQVWPGGIWQASDAAAAQVIIDGYNPLPYAKAAKIKVIKVDGLARIALIFPALESFDMVNLEAERWQSLTAGAKSPTANFTKLINTYTAATNGIAAVNAAVNLAGVAAVTVAWP